MGQGSDSDYARDIPIRVSHLETSVSELHSDNQRTNRTLASVVAQLEAQGKTLTAIDVKLDQTRTKRPEFATIAGYITILITVSILAFAPVYREMSAAATERKGFSDALMARAYTLGQTDARLTHVESRAELTATRLLRVESDRFTKQDAQRLEDNLREEIYRNEHR